MTPPSWNWVWVYSYGYGFQATIRQVNITNIVSALLIDSEYIRFWAISFFN
jgi:hypothetical protein